MCVCLSSLAQPTILDPCFSSGTPGTSFASTANLADVGANADLCTWTGTTWNGDWPGANLTLAPPINSAGCRAIWCGSGTAWTTGGEGFGVRLSAGLVTGVAYSFSVTYVSHGTGSTGAFNPRVYTNTTGALAGAFSLGGMPAVGATWTTNMLNFTATAAQSGHTWLIFGTWPNFSSGFINSFCSTCNNSVLPIELLSFEATPMETKTVKCEWATATEKNNKHFILQRSKDAENFIDVEKLDGAGDSNLPTEYSVVDKNPFPGMSYYRLKMLAVDGEISYSNLKTVSFSNFTNSKLYPNPTSGILNIPQIQNKDLFTAENSEIEILNYTGEVVLKLPYNSNVNVSELKAGYYILKIKHFGEKDYSYKFIRE
ncbi:MAG: T9SS type A sorting domain-containing protein [Bacteroidia bacterium]|nr:T9SS type A sorting domain-containing protein [Bacteroidia bacterium]